ncbi:MAG: hypothetical protein AB1333_03035 [Patescibacteria group bacterium]
MTDKEIIFNTPKNLDEFTDQFVIFFSEDAEPKVLFNSFIAEETYKKAEEIKIEQNREPVVIRVQKSNISNSITQMLSMRF